MDVPAHQPPEDKRVDALLSLPRGRRSMQRRLVIWALALVIVPTFLSALWLNRVADVVMGRAHMQSVEMIGRTTAASLSGRIGGGWSADAMHVIDGLVAADERLAMVLVTDADGEVLHRRVLNPTAASQLDDRPGGGAGLEIGRATPLKDQTLAAARLPVWSRPNRDPGGRVINTGEPVVIEGFVVLVIRDQMMPQMLSQLEAAHLGGAGVVCLLAVPLVVLGVRRWMAPLKGMLHATQALANDLRPEPVPEHSHDELGLLAGAFNHMACKLSTAFIELEATNAHLEDTVAIRTAELEAANGRLTAEMKDKDDFIRAVTHDLNAPLRNIDGMAKLLLMKHRCDLPGAAAAKLERISANAGHGAELLSDLLEVSKIRTRPIKAQTIDTAALVHEVVEGMRYDIEAADIRLQIEGDWPSICGDRNRIRQVLQNLLDNAVKYMMDSELRRITLRADAGEGQYRFTVEDTGRGIAAEDLPRVFQVFSRAVHSGTHEVQGRGVGLATVKSIVESHGGSISVSSALGRGSTFTVSLPTDRVDATRAAAPDAGPAEATGSRA